MSRNGYAKLDDEYSGQERADNKRKRKSKHTGATGFTESSSLVGQVQNVKSKNVYVFSDGTVTDNPNESMELTSMTQRVQSGSSQKSYKSTSSNQYDDIVTKEIPLQKSDTLHSLSIKFRCPVSTKYLFCVVCKLWFGEQTVKFRCCDWVFSISFKALEV